MSDIDNDARLTPGQLHRLVDMARPLDMYALFNVNGDPTLYLKSDGGRECVAILNTEIIEDMIADLSGLSAMLADLPMMSDEDIEAGKARLLASIDEAIAATELEIPKARLEVPEWRNG
jgi:hypothetical protein